MEYKVELLAPAGSYEGLEAALAAGADAVYLGGANFGARAYARNFGEEELLRAIDAAHLRDRKLYLTVNTLLKNRELEEQLYDYIRPLYEAGLDAAIVQDMGVFSFLKEEFPELHLHASTQMTVTGPAGMTFLESLGASRVVAARELSLSELFAMHEASPIEIEAFVHGALCYSYSGQCLMSSFLGGRSGNRGRCAQPCRLPYTLADRKQGKGGEQCPLSLKDICTIDLLPEIIKAGVTSLKIEGRMKQPGYTAGVTEMYRKYLDLFLEKGEESYHVKKADRERLLNLFSRGGSCTGYYKTYNGPQMLALKNEKKMGDQERLTEQSIPKIPVCGTLRLFKDQPAELTLNAAGHTILEKGGEVQTAQNQPLEKERVRAQMDRLGNTSYMWETLDIRIDEGIFVPMKTLNDLRRRAFEKLETSLLQPYRRECPQAVPGSSHTGQGAGASANNSGGFPGFYVSCEDLRTADLLLSEDGVRGLYLPMDVMRILLEKGRKANKELYLSTPHMTRGEIPEAYLTQAEDFLKKGMTGILVRNLETYGALKRRGWERFCVLDHSLYTWNDRSVDFWEKEGVLRITAPLELNEKELLHRRNGSSEMLVYGYLPMMVSAQCLKKSLDRCTADGSLIRIRDRKRAEFPVKCCCNPWKMDNTGREKSCYNIIYNSVPYGLQKEKQQVCALHMRALRLSFTMEKPEEALGIFREFYRVYAENGPAGDRAFTKGHFKRGAE